MRANSANETRVLGMPRHDMWGAAVSPDASMVAYRVQNGTSSGGLVPSNLYVARADGSHAVQITRSGNHDTQVAWSPDGTRIAYVSMPAGTSGNFSILTANRNGANARTIVTGTTTVQNPTWSPDGRWIAFQSRNGIRQQLAVVASRGGPVRWLASTAGGAEPYWASTGAIVFDKDDGSLWLTRASASSAQLLNVRGSEPAVSPNGKRIAYVSSAGGAAQIWIARIDGTHAADVTQLAWQDASHPSWRSNTEVLFTAAGQPAAIYTEIGKTYGIDAVIVSSLIMMGVILLLVRRWRLPLGAITALLGLYSIALATQADTYWDIPAALIAGIVADTAIALLKDRARAGNGFYILGFVIPFVMSAAYIGSVRLQSGALGWPPNMTIGSPFIAGFAGLLVAFCFAPPLPAPSSAEQAFVSPEVAGARPFGGSTNVSV